MDRARSNSNINGRFLHAPHTVCLTRPWSIRSLDLRSGEGGFAFAMRATATESVAILTVTIQQSMT
jgi:hypothetical protein